MSQATDKKAESAASARDIAERLRVLETPAAIRGNNNEWARRAQVNTSFFTNLKKGSDPSIHNLRRVLQVAGTSLPEFFAHEARGALVRKPNRQELEAALHDALADLPKQPGRRVEYLAEVVEALLELPADRPAELDVA